MTQPVPIITPTRVFEDHTHTVYAVADVPYSRRIVTSSEDRLVRLWDLKTGEVLKKMEGHTGEVMGLAVSRDGQMIVTGDENGELIAWQAKTGESLTKPIKVHGSALRSLDFSPDDAFIVTASSAPNDKRVKFWNTKTWAQYPGSYDCGSTIRCVRYARSGVYMLAVATDKDIQIYVGEKLQKRFKGHSHGTLSLAWSPDRTRLLSGGDDRDPNIREWDTSSWTQVGLPWTGHTYKVNSIAFNSSGTHAVSASSDNSVRLWQLSDKQTIAIFQHTSSVVCAAFSADGMRIFSGGYDKKVTEWTTPMGSLLAGTSKENISYSKIVAPAPMWEITTTVPVFDPEVQKPAPTQLALKAIESESETESSDHKSLQAVSMTGSFDSNSLQAVSANESSDFKSLQPVSMTGGFDSILTTESSDSKFLQAVSTTTSFDSKSQESSSTIQSALNGQFSSKAEQSVTESEQFVTKSEQLVSKTLIITADELLAITKTIRIASITGDLYTAEKVLTQDIIANATNFASYANRSFVMARKLNWENALQDANKSLAIRTSMAGYIAKGIALCGKQLVEDARTSFDLAFTFTHGNMDATAIALFNANRHKEALLRVEQLSADPSADPPSCSVVVASLRVQLGTIAFNGAHHSEAIEHFTAAVKASTFLAKSAAPAACEAFTVLFGWDIGSLWETSNKKLILALLGAGKLGEAFESYRFAMDTSDEATKTSLHSWVLTLSL
ncbi:WD40-repeat-containing domain protein [Suillus americanus]|nr:WD40-repeat-containing domain protein [Suillus americanus]